MDDRFEAEVPGDLDGLVPGDVVDQDDVVDDVVRDVRVRALERPRGVVGRHHDDDPRARRVRRGGLRARAVGCTARRVARRVGRSWPRRAGSCVSAPRALLSGGSDPSVASHARISDFSATRLLPRRTPPLSSHHSTEKKEPASPHAIAHLVTKPSSRSATVAYTMTGSNLVPVVRSPSAHTLGDRTVMFERLFGNRTADPAVAERVPPGQYVSRRSSRSCTTARCRRRTSRRGTSRSTARSTPPSRSRGTSSRGCRGRPSTPTSTA